MELDRRLKSVLFIGSEPYSPIIMVQFEDGVANLFIFGVRRVGLIQTDRVNYEELNQQVKVVLHVVVPEHVVEVALPVALLVHGEDELVGALGARDVLSVFSRFSQFCLGRLENLNLAINSNLDSATLSSQDLIFNIDTVCSPIAVRIVILLDDINVFIQSALDLELHIVLDVPNKVDKDVDSVHLVVGVSVAGPLGGPNLSFCLLLVISHRVRPWPSVLVGPSSLLSTHLSWRRREVLLVLVWSPDVVDLRKGVLIRRGLSTGLEREDLVFGQRHPDTGT
jgi:hypothetical protein